MSKRASSAYFGMPSSSSKPGVSSGVAITQRVPNTAQPTRATSNGAQCFGCGEIGYR